MDPTKATIGTCLALTPVVIGVILFASRPGALTKKSSGPILHCPLVDPSTKNPK